MIDIYTKNGTILLVEQEREVVVYPKQIASGFAFTAGRHSETYLTMKHLATVYGEVERGEKRPGKDIPEIVGTAVMHENSGDVLVCRNHIEADDSEHIYWLRTGTMMEWDLIDNDVYEILKVGGTDA